MNYLKDRMDAGKQLAIALKHFKNHADTLILALPRGGVPVAYEIALALNLPMTIFLVRKLGLPGHEEYAMGAIAEGGICLLNDEALYGTSVSEKQIQQVIDKEKAELTRRLNHYRHGEPLPLLKDKTIILVDDGIATGATIKAAIQALKTFQPSKIIIAVPVASAESIAELSPMVNDIVCLWTPTPFYGVGQWYQSFPQTTDEEVLHLLSQIKKP